MKYYVFECGYLNEEYHVFAENEEEADKFIFSHFLDCDLLDPEEVEYNLVDYYEIEPGLIRVAQA